MIKNILRKDILAIYCKIIRRVIKLNKIKQAEFDKLINKIEKTQSKKSKIIEEVKVQTKSINLNQDQIILIKSDCLDEKITKEIKKLFKKTLKNHNKKNLRSFSSLWIRN